MHTRTPLGYVLLLPFGLLLGNGDLGGPAQALNVPLCQPGELLTARKGHFFCIDPLHVLLPQALDCGGGALTNAGQPDPEHLICAPPAAVDPALQNVDPALQNLEARTAADSARLQALAAVQGTARFVGLTSVTTTGLISHPGTETGILSALALCNDDFLGSHMCTGYELYTSTIASPPTISLGSDSTFTGGWIFHPSWRAPLAVGQVDLEGLGDSCAGYTYGQNDRGWSGLIARVGMDVIGEKTLMFKGGHTAPCDTPMPIACCR